MNFIKFHCYCRDIYIPKLIDLKKNGIVEILIPSYLSKNIEDMEILLNVQNNEITLVNCNINYRIGNTLSSGSCIEINQNNNTAIIVITDVENGFSFFTFGERIELSIGKSLNFDVVYKLESKETLLSTPYIIIKKDIKNDQAYYEVCDDSYNIIYINSKISQKTALLNFGDVICFLGFTFVYLNGYFAVDMLQNFVSVNKEFISDLNFTSANSRDEILFSRTTRIYNEELKNDVSIDIPEQSSVSEELPAALTIGPMITMGVSMVASMAINIGNSSSMSGFIMSGSMLVGMILWPSLSRNWEKKRQKQHEIMRISKYKNYVEQVEKSIVENINNNYKIYNDMKVSPSDLISWFTNNSFRRVWERSHYDEDFLEIRLGVGDVINPSKIEVPRQSYNNNNDVLISIAYQLKEKYSVMHNGPITIDLKEFNSIGLIGMEALVRNILANLIMQLSTLHDSSELKLAVLYNETSSEFDWVKKLPHVWDDNMDFRFIAQNKSEVQTMFRNLLEIIQNRKQGSSYNEDRKLPVYVLIAIDKELIEDMSVDRFISSTYKDIGFASIFAFSEISYIPNGCKTIMQCYQNTTSIYTYSKDVKGFKPFEKEIIKPNDIKLFSDKISLFRRSSRQSISGIPSNVSFLDLFKVGSFEQINVLKLWALANPQKTLAVPIGIKSGGEYFYLDIHEKYHGSHGLMAGTTGSGKSECIQAIILSLAAHFHPDDISFVLIDFKGGGMANSFLKLPHLAGTITNLGNQIKRSMISLNAEMKNRQHSLKQAGVNHIDKYQSLYKEGKVNVAMPHLVIVSDEFAELKQQQPEFMAELISIARIGRSLGVHLILATQKPTGVVDDQIWSNTRFKISLKVADKSDSMGMIGSPLAASITLPGRAYIQVGYNEVFEQLQTAYTGADYVPAEEYFAQDEQQVIQIDSCGQVISQAVKKPKGIETSIKLTQLDAFVNYLYDLQNQHGIKSHPIWENPLPYLLTISNIEKVFEKSKNGEIYVSVGLIDDPELQQIVPLSVNISSGHIALYGMPASGKTTFIQTFLYTLVKKYSPNEIQFELIDFGGRSLEIFENTPHANRVMFPNDIENIALALNDILDEIEQRRNLFAKARQETLSQYMKSTETTIPTIILLIDNYGRFSEEAEECLDMLISIIKEGAKYGVVVFLASNSVNAISYRLNDYFTEKIVLQLGDSMDYATVLGSIMGMTPENVKGRGMIRYEGRLTEFQTALSFDETDDGLRSKMIISDFNKLFGKLNKSIENKTEHVSSKELIQTKTLPINTKNKKIPSGGVNSIIGFGKNKSTEILSSIKNKNGDMTYFMCSDENGLQLGSSRNQNIDYILPYGGSLFILTENEYGSSELMEFYAKRCINKNIYSTYFYCNRETELDQKITKIQTASEIHLAIEQLIISGGYLFVEGLQNFYKEIDDKDLELIINSIEAKNKFCFIVSAKIDDAKMFKDYPLGIFLFKTSANGMIANMKINDAISLFTPEFLDKTSSSERKMLITSKSPILFQKSGDFAKILAYKEGGND